MDLIRNGIWKSSYESFEWLIHWIVLEIKLNIAQPQHKNQTVSVEFDVFIH